MLKKALQTSPSAANPAVLRVKTQEAVPTTAAAVKCSTQLALNAARPAKFRSSRAMIVLYTAATALQTEDNYKIADFGAPFGAHFFYFLNTMIVIKLNL